jgi:hypothetical protein
MKVRLLYQFAKFIRMPQHKVVGADLPKRLVHGTLMHAVKAGSDLRGAPSRLLAWRRLSI